MPNRIIKESIHTSEDVNRMSDFQFRLWVSLITYVDDFGRGDARPAVIKGTCFPLRDRIALKDIDAALKALAGIGCVGLYEVDGKPYLYFPTWESHQRIQSKKSKYPAPDESENHGESRCFTVSHGESPLESNPNTNPNLKENPNPNGAEYSASAALNDAILSFVEFRKKIKKPMTDRAIGLMIKKLNEFSSNEDEQIAILNQSILNGWTGIYELKKGGDGHGNTSGLSTSVGSTSADSNSKWHINYSG